MVLNSFREAFFGDAHYRDMGRSEKAAYLLPIRLSVLYLVLSFIVYIIGPYEWVTYKPILFYGLLFFYLLAFWGGYRMGILRPVRSSYEWTEKHTAALARILSILIAVNFFVYFLNTFRNYGLASLDFRGFFRMMIDGIKNPGYGYYLKYVRSLTLRSDDLFGGYVFTAFYYLWSFVQYPIMIGSLLFFKKLKRYGKVFVVLNLALILVYFLSVGTTIDVFTVFLFVELPAILGAFILWRSGKITKKHVIRLICMLLIGFLIIGVYFTCMMLSRNAANYEDPSYNVGGVGIDLGRDETDFGNELASPDIKENYIHIPPVLMKFWLSFSSYLTQGYYGFSLSLTQDWTPMFGLGSNMFVVDFISNHFYDIKQFTYQAKLDPLGWNSRVQWHTMFSWIANDLSPYGVIIYMLVIGFLFGAMFKDAITTCNPFAQISIFYFILMIFFMPCNNQLGQRSETLFSFILIIACWIISRHPFSLARRILDKLAK